MFTYIVNLKNKTNPIDIRNDKDFMCQTKAEGGARCSDASKYGHALRNVKAKEQYWTRKLKAATSKKAAESIQKTLNLAKVDVENLKTAHKLYGTNIIPYEIEMTPAGKKVLDALYSAGLNPLVVGGSIRDKILDLNSKDLDIEVYGGETAKVIRALRTVGNVDEVGKTFGVLKIIVDGEDMDISLPRTDNKSGEGHRGFEISVDPFLSPEKASSRRDFTINSLLYDTRNKVIVDPNDGMNDLNKKILRHVSDAFDEDPLRVLRGVQLASRLGFKLSDETAKKSYNLKKEFESLSDERIRVEFYKLYTKGKNSPLAFRTLQSTGWDECFHGLKEINNKDLWREMQKVDSSELNSVQRQVFLSALIARRLKPKDAEKFLQKTVNNDTDRSAARNLLLVKKPKKLGKVNMRRWAHTFGPGVNINSWCSFNEFIGNNRDSRIVRAKAEKLSLLYSPNPDFIQGRDILTVFPSVKPGPWVGEIIKSARGKQEEDVFHSTSAGLSWVKENFSLDSENNIISKNK